jgi:hypothetical protein
MSEREWMVANRARIDREILRQCPNVRMPITESDRRLWVDNDYPLYCARRDECKASGSDTRGVFWCKAH